MLGLLLLRHYSARAWTWPPLLWWETGLLLLLNGFSLSTAGPLFQPWPAEILQKGGRRHISSELYLFPGAGLLFQPWAAEILQKGASQPDVKLASIWIFLVASPHTEAVPVSALSVPAISARELRFLFVADPFRKHHLEPGLQSTVFKPGPSSSVGRADGP